MKEDLERELRSLMELQTLDGEMSQFEEKKGRIPKVLHEMNQRVNAEEGQIQEKELELKRLEAVRQRKEGELRTEESRIKKLSAKQEGIKKEREYHAFVREVGELKRMVSELESEILKDIAEIEKRAQELEAFRKDYQLRLEKMTADRQSYEKELAEAETYLASTFQRRRELASKISRESLSRYEGVRKARGVLVVVAVRQGICQGCHMNIPPQLYNQILKSEGFFTCPNCYRILYKDNTV
ncbi:MAG: hypothetical protein HY538_06200 [Deltaproteobacteria bacterium]|nr:hypothetical protein [Deltaproteobacteria bacterium]